MILIDQLRAVVAGQLLRRVEWTGLFNALLLVDHLHGHFGVVVSLDRPSLNPWGVVGGYEVAKMQI